MLHLGGKTRRMFDNSGCTEQLVVQIPLATFPKRFEEFKPSRADCICDSEF